MPIKTPQTIGRKLGNAAVGTALGLSLFVGDGRKSEPKIETLSKNFSVQLLKSKEIQRSSEEVNKEAENYYTKLNKKTFTKKDIGKLMNQIVLDLNTLKPDLKQAGFFNVEGLISELKTLSSFFIERPITNAKNDPFGMFAAQIIALASFLHLTKNMRRLGIKRGYKLKEPFSLDNYKSGSNKAIPFVIFLIANVYHIGLITGLVTNPTLRYYVSKLLQKFR